MLKTAYIDNFDFLKDLIYLPKYIYYPKKYEDEKYTLTETKLIYLNF